METLSARKVGPLAASRTPLELADMPSRDLESLENCELLDIVR